MAHVSGKKTIISFAGMLTKAQSKYIRSLSQQKYRKEHNVFIAEGDKIAREWLASTADIEIIAATKQWAAENDEAIAHHHEAIIAIIEEHELQAISQLQTPNKVLLVVRKPVEQGVIALKHDEWAIALDGIQDPGNMGTIIRTADWFGIRQVICSEDCVDIYNPKVVQAAMGSHLRINFHTGDLHTILHEIAMPICVAVLDGHNIYEHELPTGGVLVIGNEGRGVGEDIIHMARHKLTIPRKGGAESLNAAVSAGILCALLTK
jgi:TrmH family RNA methyltransferase